jgi:hypothetical protein
MDFDEALDSLHVKTGCLEPVNPEISGQGKGSAKVLSPVTLSGTATTFPLR